MESWIREIDPQWLGVALAAIGLLVSIATWATSDRDDPGTKRDQHRRSRQGEIYGVSGKREQYAPRAKKQDPPQRRSQARRAMERAKPTPKPKKERKPRREAVEGPAGLADRAVREAYLPKKTHGGSALSQFNDFVASTGSHIESGSIENKLLQYLESVLDADNVVLEKSHVSMEWKAVAYYGKERRSYYFTDSDLHMADRATSYYRKGWFKKVAHVLRGPEKQPFTNPQKCFVCHEQADISWYGISYCHRHKPDEACKYAGIPDAPPRPGPSLPQARSPEGRVAFDQIMEKHEL